MVPLALALLAIVLGGAGLYFGLTANQKLAPISESIDEGTSSSARLEKQIAAYDTKISELSAELTQLRGSVQRAGRETSQALRDANQAKQGFDSNRAEIIKLAEAMQQLANSGVTRSAPAAASSGSSTSTASSTDTAPAASGSESTYLIKSGDTFGKIATLKGVSLDALLDANPDADPRRLRIGQEINIPAN